MAMSDQPAMTPAHTDSLLSASATRFAPAVSVVMRSMVRVVAVPLNTNFVCSSRMTEPSGITQMAELDADYVVVVQRGANGLDLKSIAKSAL